MLSNLSVTELSHRIYIKALQTACNGALLNLPEKLITNINCTRTKRIKKLTVNIKFLTA